MPPSSTPSHLSARQVPKLRHGKFEMHFDNDVSVVAHPNFGRGWFSRLYVDHKCVAGSDGATLGEALRSLTDEIHDETGVRIEDVLA